MKRRDLIKGIGAAGVSAMFPVHNALSKINTISKRERMRAADCWVTPSKTEGPFYFDTNLYRKDIRTDSTSGELHDGLPLNMSFTVINANCEPLPNVLVDIWHCDKDGFYSGYNQPAGDKTGQNFLRGIQVTDENGKASFLTSYPGWYPGRATHIHFKVRLDSTAYVTSQFAFPENTNNEVYATELYSGRGVNPILNEEDNIFGSANPEFLIMQTARNNSGGYDGTFTIGVNSPTGVEGIPNIPEGYSLEQNYPNPFNPSTNIKYSIPESANVKLVVYDLLGREVETLRNTWQNAGTYELKFDAGNLNSGMYVYRLVAGSYDMAKEMLLIK